MPWIEGIGDEVTITFSVLIGLVIILLAWYSTGIRDIPFISVIIVQLTRRRYVRQNVDQPQSQSESSQNASNDSQGESAPLAEQSVPTSGPGTDEIGFDNTNAKNKPKEANDQPENTIDNLSEDVQASEVEANLTRTLTQQSEPTTSISTEIPSLLTETVSSLSEQELRQKRLDFFKNGTKVEQQTDSTVKSEARLDEEQVPNYLNTERPVRPVGDEQASVPESSVGTSVDPAASRPEVVAGDQPDVPSPETEDAEQSPDEIRVRIKFLNDEQRLVTCSPQDTIGNFRRKYFSTELSESKLVRFIFNGQDLRNDSGTLQSYNIMDNSVLHCLITQPQQGNQARADDEDSFDMGFMMFPLFGLLLSVVWYMRFTYRQFFNVTSTLTLGGITFLYLAAFISSFRGRHHEHLD